MTDDIPSTPRSRFDMPEDTTGAGGSSLGDGFFAQTQVAPAGRDLDVTPPVDLACYDCDVVYKKRSDEWTACPRCGEELTEVTIE